MQMNCFKIMLQGSENQLPYTLIINFSCLRNKQKTTPQEVTIMIGLLKSLFIITEVLLMPIMMAIEDPELGKAMFQQLVLDQIVNLFT